ncbi:DUF551 domain-containing protein [Salmonella enterica]|uniref:DUF551 domain-containing protein n=1 Tax=Salmonella enterica TaxID=28901 RepID=UPI001F4E201E|nr:DUF551 domain-containing protein [Salmonella enterica]
MSNLKPGNVYIEISHNQAGGLSLCVGNDDGGYRISGDKVGGCETLKCFEVNADELIEKIREHIKKVTAEPEHIDEIAIQAGINPAWADAYMQGYHDAVAAMLQAGNSPVTTDGWIPVSERMPPNKPGSYEYIVFDSLNNKAHHDYWNVPDGSCDDFSPFWNHYGKYVTHWMPLPAAPQQEDE